MTTEPAQDSIVTFCKKCKAQLRAPAGLAGKRGKCAQCGAAIVIPLKSEAPAAPPAEAAKPAAQPPAAESAAQPPPQRVNMVLMAVLAVLAGLILAVLIYVLFLMGPSGSILPRAPVPRSLPAETPAPPPAAVSVNTDPPAAKAETAATNEPEVPSIIRLGPKESTPAPKPARTAKPPAPTKAWTSPNAGPQPGRPPFGPPSGRPPSRDAMRGHRSSSSGRLLEADALAGAVEQGVVSGKVTVRPDKTVEIALKREILTPMSVVFRQGTRAVAGKGGFVVVAVERDVTLDLSTSTEATTVLPLAEPTNVKTLILAPSAKEEAGPPRPDGAAVR